jgi:ferredoxin/flavodoxin---NADP+ reductase
MNRIVKKSVIGPNVKQIIVEAPDIAKNAKAGQFIVLRVNAKGERIPLTIAGRDEKNGLITIIFQEVGKTTHSLGALNEGDSISDILGPLGHATEITKSGTVVCIGGGVGVAEILPVASAFSAAGNRVIGIIGARNKDLLILENEMKGACEKLYVTTDDGSYGEKGFVSDVLRRLIADGTHIDEVYAIGPVPMMRVVANVTKEHAIKTVVSLNPIMVDGTGMCGACRVSVGGKTYFACVDGPEFDAHQVNWEELTARLSLFKSEEKKALEKYQCEACKSK